MDIYHARWKNAVRIAEHINKLIKEGYLVYDEDHTLIDRGFLITANRIVLIYDSRYSVEYFNNNKLFDDGLYTTIKEYNKLFEKWLYVPPAHIHKLSEDIKKLQK